MHDKLGFIGLGVMGEPMCRNLAGKHRGKVLAQRPAPGAVLPAWSGVRLVVGKGRRR